ncbi:MAG: glycoside hydrolase family 2 protein [Barnesiella sp.]|nr:glycoside hydrolase family 2 protein [Barnesiella sp.]
MIRKYAIMTLMAAAALSAAGRESINIGNTPWRFTKIVDGAENLLKYGTVTVDGTVSFKINDNKRDTREQVAAASTISADLFGSHAIDRLVLTFADDNIHGGKVSYTLYDENRNAVGQGDFNLSDHFTLLKENDISDIGNTVGFVQRTVGTSFALPLDKSFRYADVTVASLTDADGKNASGELVEFELIPPVTAIPDTELSAANYDDSDWEQVGIPHCFNEFDTFLNATTGERCWRGEVWYRKGLKIPKSYKGKRVTLQFYGVNIGMTVYVNGNPVKGNSAVEQPAPVTHVGSSIPFEVDITPYLQYGKENTVAVRVSNSRDTFFAYPNFAENEGFGQAMGGIVGKVMMNVTEPVYIPSNCYSPHNQWGTYFGTVSADKESAVVRMLTRVQNAKSTPVAAELTVEVLDAEGKSVLKRTDRGLIMPNSATTIDHTDTIANPTLWYPIGTSGKPYLYDVVYTVKVNGKTTDTRRERMGLRTITWDKDHCYVNGEKCILRGFGNRNLYPGLGAGLPEAFQWQDIARIAACGGNTLRVGHQAPFPDAFRACDEYGVMLIVNSGDNEWALKDQPALTYKREYDRDLIIAYRNHPCVAVWESNNGLPWDGERYWPVYTKEEVDKWDFIAPRLVLNRDGFPEHWNPADPIVIGYTNRYEKHPDYPSLNAEVYGTNWSGNPSWCIARFDYDNEKPFSQYYVQNYLDDLSNKACGWVDWMLAETYGEGYTIYLNGMRDQKSLGSCAMDANRFPKLKYRIYQNALWVPYEERPGVALQSHWNYSGVQNVDAWSNCPAVELLLNGESKGRVTPDAATRRCTWEGIEWEPGLLEAVGLDADGNEVCRESVRSAGEPYAIKVERYIAPSLPDGSDFPLTANGSDAFVITATVVDRDGNWCPRADNMLRFEVEGEASYKGSYNFYVSPEKDLSYHSPGDTELQAEGGLMRIVARTTFTPGDINITVTSPGLQPGTCTVRSQRVNN